MHLCISLSPKGSKRVALLDFYRRLVKAGVLFADSQSRGFDKEDNPAALDSESLHRICDGHEITATETDVGCVLWILPPWELGEIYNLEKVREYLVMAESLDCDARASDGTILRSKDVERELGRWKRSMMAGERFVGVTTLVDRFPQAPAPSEVKESMTFGELMESLDLPSDPLDEMLASLSEGEKQEMIDDLRKCFETSESGFVSVPCVACGKHTPYPKECFEERLRAGGLADIPDFTRIRLDGCLLCREEGTGPWVRIG